MQHHLLPCEEFDPIASEPRDRPANSDHPQLAKKQIGRNEDTGASTFFSFGPFRLFPVERLLKRDGEAIPLGSRAFDTLIALVERAGEVVTRSELISRVWRNTIVEEANLRVQIASVRKILGGHSDESRYIVNVTGRGYSFVQPVTCSTIHGSSSRGETVTPAGNQRLPARLTRMVGRDEIRGTLVTQLMTRRLVSIVGAGGIGKTTVAISVAYSLLERFKGAVYFVDFAVLTSSDLVAPAVAEALELPVQTQNPVRSIVAFIRHKKILLVLDNCEHVLEGAAPLVECLVNEAPEVHVLATSREALRVEGEHVHLLYSLECAPEKAGITAVEALRYPATQLFMERAVAGGYQSGLTDADAPVVARICRRLDGIPLAIELVASRVGSHSIHGTAELLNNRFGALWQGRRTALPRHQTLNAMLDWSYRLLTEYEKAVLRWLSVFVGEFTLEAACFVSCEAEHPSGDVIVAITNLVSKSLIYTSTLNSSTNYRLLDTTRSYALEKLDQYNESKTFMRRHAEFFRGLSERAEHEWEARPTSEWLADYERQMDNLRAALDWAFSPLGDQPIGVALAAATVPLWMHLSLLDECHERAEQAIAVLSTEETPDLRREMKLHAALASSSWWRAAGVYTQLDVAGLDSIWMKALELAEGLEDTEYQLRSHWGRYSFYLGMGHLRTALDAAHQFRSLALERRSHNDALIGDRMIGVVQHLLGDQASAHRHTEHMLANFVLRDDRSHELIRFQFDQRVTALTVFARCLYLRAFPDGAMETATDAVDEALQTDHALSLCYALAHSACPTTLWVGNLLEAERYITMLLETSATHSLASWGKLGRNFQGVLLIRHGQLKEGINLLRAGLAEARGMMSHWISIMFLGELAAGLGHAGQATDGLAAVAKAIELANRTEALWISPELLRIKGELILLDAADEAMTIAKSYFRRALHWAHRQEALAWELRAATSLARLLRHERRTDDAQATLQSVIDRVTEGFTSADIKAAKALLDELK
jgi:predicted ATPase/DNA-binding winged helix-turn-helix (wHTH) protein